MSAFYFAVCDSLKERLEPGTVARDARFYFIVRDDFARLLTFTMALKWCGLPCRILSDDHDEEYFEARRAYRDITAEMVEEFHEYFEDGLILTRGAGSETG